MRRMTKAMFGLGVILLLFGMTAGCGKSEKKYFGKYVMKEQGFGSETSIFLEIKRDSTYKWEVPSPFGSMVTTGRWEIERWENGRDEKREAIVLCPDETPGVPQFVLEIRGNTLVDRLRGGTFVKQEDNPGLPILQNDILGIYHPEEPGDSRFLELKRDTCFLGSFGRWKIEVKRYPLENEVEYKIVLIVGGFSDYGYIKGDTIRGLSSFNLVRQEGAELIKGGYGKLWNIYIDQKQGVLIEFKEGGIATVVTLTKWERKGDIINLYTKGEKKPLELKIKGKTLAMPQGMVFVKQE